MYLAYKKGQEHYTANQSETNQWNKLFSYLECDWCEATFVESCGGVRPSS